MGTQPAGMGRDGVQPCADGDSDNGDGWNNWDKFLSSYSSLIHA